MFFATVHTRSTPTAHPVHTCVSVSDLSRMFFATVHTVHTQSTPSPHPVHTCVSTSDLSRMFFATIDAADTMG
jgi:hypothetical protein